MTTVIGKERASRPTVELLKATAKGKLYKVIQAINDGAELAVNKNGHNALHIASHKGFLDIVRILLSAGCGIDVQDDNGDTALHRACIAGHDLIARRLIEEGCSVDRQNRLGDTALHEAASRGYSRCVKVLIEGRVNIGLKNKNLDTAIHLACANSHSGSLRLLLSAFPHSSPKNAQDDTPLHVSVRFGHVTCSRVLISSKCNVNLQNKIGNTALHIATIARHRKLVRILLDAGACPKSVLNNEQKCAIDIARDNDYGEIAIMLLSGARAKSVSGSRGRSRKKYGTSARRSRSEPRMEAEQNEKVNKNDHQKTPRASSQLLTRPKSATLPRKQYYIHAKRQKHERHKSETHGSAEDILEKQQHSLTVNPFVVPQLYSLYRDCHGNVRQQPVVEQLPNPTAEVVSSLTNAVTDTKGELLREMKKTNCMLEKRLGELEDRTRFRVAKLDQVTKERIHAERTHCLHRIDRRAMMERAVYSCLNKGCICSGTHDGSQESSPIARNPSSKPGGQTFSPNDSIRTTPIKDIQTLQPYQTVKILSKNNDLSPLCSSPKLKESSKKVDNLSDSAYSSLCPKQSSKASSASRRDRNRADLCFKPVHGHFNSKTLPHKFTSLSEGEYEVTNEVTQRFFENVTHAMEDWYERRLKEISEKQQREMDKKVAELENKVRMLRASHDHCNIEHNCDALVEEMV